MKLKNFNGAVRKADGHVKVGVATPVGYIYVAVQKTDLLNEMKRVCPDANAEVHMSLDDRNVVVVDEGARHLVDEVLGYEPHRNTADSAITDADIEGDDDLLIEEEADEDESLAAMTNAASEDDDLDGLLG